MYEECLDADVATSIYEWNACDTNDRLILRMWEALFDLP